MALEPNGPLKLEILEKLKRQFAADPWSCRREMEAEFADDADSWLSMALITRCVDQNLEYIPEGTILTCTVGLNRRYWMQISTVCSGHSLLRPRTVWTRSIF